MPLLAMAANALPHSYLNRTLTLQSTESTRTDWITSSAINALESFHSTLQFRRILHEEISP